MALSYICNSQLAIYNFVICVDSKSVLCALKSWNCKMRGDIFYEVKYLIHCIMYKGIGIEFCWVPSHFGLYWNEISDKLAKQGAMKNICLRYHPITYYYVLMRLIHYLRRLYINKLKKVNCDTFLF